MTNILSPAGTVVKGYDYDEFGQSSKKGDDNFLNEMTFTGSVMDATSSLQYMNARYYQPSTGRFLSQDTYSGNPYDPWTQHLYSYTGNNPVNFIDPTGHSMEGLRRQINGYKAQLEKATFSRDVYHNAMKNYDPVKNADLYLHANDKYREYSLQVNELTTKVDSLEREYNALLKLQKLVDNKQYMDIRQRDYSDLSLFDNSNVSKSGCGMIAAIIADSKLGGTVDVHDAYTYFNQPGNQWANTGAIAPYAVVGYMIEKGYTPNPEGFDLGPSGVFITYYQYTYLNSDNKPVTNWHYVCLTTDPNSKVMTYNNANRHESFRNFMTDDDDPNAPKEHVDFVIGLTSFR